MQPKLKPIVSAALLNKFRTTPNLPVGSWYLITAVTLCVLNRPFELPAVWNYALANSAIPGSDTEDYVRKQYQTEKLGTPQDIISAREDGRETALQIARRIREGLLKSAIIGGLPKAINALHTFRQCTPGHLQSDPNASPTGRRSELQQPATALLTRGADFFDNTYGKISRRVSSNLANSYDDLGLTAQLLYSYILSNTKVLTAKETSFVLIAGLIPQDVNPQLKGHLKGAVNNGATLEEVRAVRSIVLELVELHGVDWDRREPVAKI
ncbi:hypothetical protein BJ508DRAFT_418035 [Ascobolus immersus RN42]|uniref:Carboxymuconolactone decarboxylase-like domain-containing protein n=1 Tax=Ascobolus immersus RN42 TaxID=1160509 RepID=A0A3N4HP66_ASCIM|nr:hypothetical protein BJ508DRAFT_418035 [Ascobolus immersus RN42]